MTTKGDSIVIQKEAEIDETLLDAVMWVESRNGKYLKSPAGALGPFQFMPLIAKFYKVDPTDDDWSDDRRGARDLLNDELKALGKIELAIASYNYGRTRLLRAIRQSLEDYGSRDFHFVSMYIPKETREYVPKVLKKYGTLRKKRAAK